MAESVSGKRKRAQVSYVNGDDELDELLGLGENEDVAVGSEDDKDIDTTYGSRKKPNTRANKKAKTAPKSKKPKNQKPFPFLSLPAELRDQIYELALTDSNGISLVSKTIKYRRTVARGVIPDQDDGYSHWNRYRRRRQPSGQQSPENQANATHNELTPALLAVNKQIHSEALGYLYQQPIILEDTYALHSFLANIGSNRPKLSDVAIRGWGSGRGIHKAMNLCALTLLADCTNLRSLFLDCEFTYLRHPKALARQIFRDGYAFLDAYGVANGRKDAALDVLQLSEWNYDKDNYWWRGRNQNLPEKEGCREQFEAELRRLLRW